MQIQPVPMEEVVVVQALQLIPELVRLAARALNGMLHMVPVVVVVVAQMETMELRKVAQVLCMVVVAAVQRTAPGQVEQADRVSLSSPMFQRRLLVRLPLLHKLFSAGARQLLTTRSLAPLRRPLSTVSLFLRLLLAHTILLRQS